jgi:hypothetical protein
MPWQCRMIEVEYRTVRRGRGRKVYTGEIVDTETGKEPRVGDMFYMPSDWARRQPKNSWTPRYLAKPARGRRALMIVFPGPRWLCIDQRYFDFKNQGGWYGDGWAISGEPPRLTLSPSVNLASSYHGHLQNGTITDDLEGRRYDTDGRQAA